MKKETMSKINAIIHESLPEQVGEELRVILEEHTRQGTEIPKLQSHLEAYKESDAKLRAENADLSSALRDLKKISGDLAAREEAIRIAATNMELSLTQRENALLKAERDTYRETLLGFSRNTVVRQKILGDQPCVVPATPYEVDQYNNIRNYGTSAHVENHPVVTDTTTQEE